MEKGFCSDEFLCSPEAWESVRKLVQMLETKTGKKEPEKLIIGWLSKLKSGHDGEDGHQGHSEMVGED